MEHGILCLTITSIEESLNPPHITVAWRKSVAVGSVDRSSDVEASLYVVLIQEVPYHTVAVWGTSRRASLQDSQPRMGLQVGPSTPYPTRGSWTGLGSLPTLPTLVALRTVHSYIAYRFSYTVAIIVSLLQHSVSYTIIWSQPNTFDLSLLLFKLGLKRCRPGSLQLS